MRRRINTPESIRDGIEVAEISTQNAELGAHSMPVPRVGGPRFERAAQTIITALASSTPTVATDWDCDFTIYHDQLFMLARTHLAAAGVVDAAAAQTAVETFHRTMLFGGFVRFRKSGKSEFFRFAATAMATICREMNAAASSVRN